MKVNNQGLVESRDEFLQKGYKLPQFDREQMIAKTKENPFWVHFGAGNIFRAFHANLMQRLLDDGTMDRGLVVCEGYDYEIIEKMYRPHDDLGIFVMLKSDGSMEKTIIGSVAESLVLDSENEAEFGRMKEIFASDSLQLATFTITEKGYSLVNGRGEQLPDVTSDLKEGPAKPKSYIGKVAALLYERFVSGQKPIAMVSTDNCSHNGDKLYEAMHAFAAAWEKAGLAEAGFEAYVNDKSKGILPLVHDRQDHTQTGCLRREDAGGGRNRGTRAGYYHKEDLCRSLRQCGGDRVSGHRGRFPERPPAA